MMGKSAHSAYTPSQHSPAALEALFVVREAIAQRIVESIIESVHTANKLNNLLIGPRGIGKTHLIAIIHNRLCADPELIKQLKIAWLPEDPYIASYNSLLLQIIQILGCSYPDDGLDEKLDQLMDLDSPAQQDFAEQLLLSMIGPDTLLIIAENIDQLLKNIDVDGQQKLRALIQNNPVFTILGSATSLSDATSKQDYPFYGFFNTRRLSPFSVDQALDMLTKLADVEHNQPLANILNSPMGRARIQALHYLAGGNPRVYTVFFDCLTCDNLNELVRPFMKLIDNMTPYYQSHMSCLAPLQRQIIDALRKIRGAATVKDISRQVMRESTVVSAQVGKLEKQGFLHKAYSSGRNNYYELQEPLMRLCLDVKEQRGENIELFIEFLRIWYSPKELGLLLADNHPGQSQYLFAAMTRAQQLPDPLQAIFDEQTKDFFDPNHPKDTLKHIETALARDPDNIDYWIKKAWCMLADGFDDRDQLRCWQEVTHRDPQAADAWHWQGILNLELIEPEQAKIAFTKAVALAPDNGNLHLDYAKCLFMLNEHKLALHEMNTGIRLQGEAKTPDQWLQRAVLFNVAGNDQAAKAAGFNALLADDQYLPAWLFVLHLFYEKGYLGAFAQLCQWAVTRMPEQGIFHRGLGMVLDRNGALDAAILSLKRAIALFNQPSQVNHHGLAFATIHLAHCYNLLGQSTSALTLLSADDPVFKSARGIFERDLEYAHTLLNLDRWQEGLSALSTALQSQAIANFHSIIFWPFAQLIVRTQNKGQWQRYITGYITVFTRINQLPILGQIIVNSLRNYDRPAITNEVALAWNDIWQSLGGNIDAFTIPLRLLAAATDYKISGNETALLTLAREERGFLTPWFPNLLAGNDGEAGAELSREIDDLLHQLDEKRNQRVDERID